MAVIERTSGHKGENLVSVGHKTASTKRIFFCVFVYTFVLVGWFGLGFSFKFGFDSEGRLQEQRAYGKRGAVSGVRMHDVKSTNN